MVEIQMMVWEKNWISGSVSGANTKKQTQKRCRRCKNNIDLHSQ